MGDDNDRLEKERLRHRVAKRKMAADKAIAEGREPNLDFDRPKVPLLTEDEKRERRRVKQANWRAENPERAREITRESMKRAAAEQAIAEGREPGKIGRPVTVSPAEKRVKINARVKGYYYADLETSRDNAAARGRNARAVKAIAEGRVPGVRGHLATFTAEELAAYLERWPRDKDVYHSRCKTSNSRAKALGAPGILAAMDIREIYIEQAGYCAFCAQPFGDEIPEIDHWKPLARGGFNGPENARLLHRRCNLTKAAKLPAVFGFGDGSPTSEPIE